MNVRHSASEFDANAKAWDDYTATPLGRLRQELSLRHVIQALATLPSSARILDAGGGTGSCAIPLAQQGHELHLLDLSPEMLAIARRNVEEEDPALLNHIQFWCAPVEELPPRLLAEQFDVVLCHTLLEYTADPEDVLRSLIAVLRPGGLISLLCTNPCADAMRWAVARMDLEKAQQALCQTTSPADLFGLPRCGMSPEAAREIVQSSGARVIAEFGIRIFADYLPQDKLDDCEFLARLLELEQVASTLHPYRLLARYHQMLGRKLGRELDTHPLSSSGEGLQQGARHPEAGL